MENNIISMKMKFLQYVMLLMALVAAGCAATVDEPMGKRGDVVLTVNTPAPYSRAGISVPAGYTMRCVLQLLDKDGNTIYSQKTADVNTSTGATQFKITSEERVKAKKALLWAGYFKDGQSVYNTSDLKAVTYNITTFDMTDVALMGAMDAFCGKVESLDDDSNVTLVRPFANVRFTPKNPEVCSKAKNLVVTYSAPASYSVYDCSAAATANITLTNSSFSSSATPWFSTFVFAPAGKTYLESAVTLALSNGLKQTIVIPTNSIPSDANMQINTTATVSGSASELNDITISVTVNPDYKGTGSSDPDTPNPPTEDPDTPIDNPSTFAVGAYINANGEAVSSSANAVAIVFHAGALGGDNGEKYGDASKTIKGYAVALNNVSDTPKGVAYSATGANTVYNNRPAKEASDKILDILRDSKLGAAYTDYVDAHPVASEKTSGWLIPDYTQLSTWLNMLYSFSSGSTYTGASEFRAKFSQTDIFGTNTEADVEFLSRTIPENETLKTVIVNHGSTPTITEAVSDKLWESTETFHIRPILVIFE